MLRNYFLVSLRNIARQKTFSAINIVGLGLSMAACLLIITIIKDSYSYDKFHPKSDQVYRIITDPIRKDGSSESYATSPFTVGQSFYENYSQVDVWTPLISDRNRNLQIGNQSFRYTGLMTDQSFFETFGFELDVGDPAQALSSPYSLVLTQALAAKLFNDEDPINQEIKCDRYDIPLRVTGVLKEYPGKTHLQFDGLVSIATQRTLEQNKDHRKILDQKQNYYSTYNFVRLRDDTDKKSAENALADLANQHFKGLSLETRDLGYAFHLQPLSEITPGVNLSNAMGGGIPVFLIWFLSILGLVIIFSACFNYTNLSIARVLKRTKEVGVRKVLGATRNQVFYQFTIESILTALLALIVSYALFYTLLPGLNGLSILSSTDLTKAIDGWLISYFILFALLVGFIAGSLPALTLAKKSPLRVLKSISSLKLMSQMWLRKSLLTIQFTSTLVLLIIVTIGWKQADHAMSINFGFDRDRILTLDLDGIAYEKIRPALSNIPGISTISGSSHVMGTWQDGSTDIRISLEDENKEVRHYFIDDQYLDQFGILLEAGENFSENLAQQSELFVLVNKKFLEDYGVGDAKEALGKEIYFTDNSPVTIRGIVEDFQFRPATYDLEPLLLRYDPTRINIVNLEIVADDATSALPAIERTMKEFGHPGPMNAMFYNQRVQGNFSELGEMIWIVGLFGFLAMVIACVGLLGLAIYSTQSRAKEISVRKVLGATIYTLTKRLSIGYFTLLMISILIAVPISYLFGQGILNMFSDRINWAPSLFLPAILLLSSITLLIVFSQTVRAAFLNPIKSLQSEA